jgi:hypothetical protein
VTGGVAEDGRAEMSIDGVASSHITGGAMARRALSYKRLNGLMRATECPAVGGQIPLAVSFRLWVSRGRRNLNRCRFIASVFLRSFSITRRRAMPNRQTQGQQGKQKPVGRNQDTFSPDEDDVQQNQNNAGGQAPDAQQAERKRGAQQDTTAEVADDDVDSDVDDADDEDDDEEDGSGGRV